MKEDTPTNVGDVEAAEAAERAELARNIDALMAIPPKPWPSIIVIGDDAVSGITPVKRRRIRWRARTR